MSRNFLKRSFKNTLAIVGVGKPASLPKNDNFILKERDVTDRDPEVKIMVKEKSEVRNNHKTVIYFGDSIARRSPIDFADDMDDDSLKKCSFSSETVTTDSSVSNQGESKSTDLPPFVDSVVNGVINIKIEGNFNKANELVRKLSMKGSRDIQKPKDYDNFDWGFVQEWRNNRYDLQEFNSSTEHTHYLVNLIRDLIILIISWISYINLYFLPIDWICVKSNS